MTAISRVWAWILTNSVTFTGSRDLAAKHTVFFPDAQMFVVRLGAKKIIERSTVSKERGADIPLTDTDWMTSATLATSVESHLIWSAFVQ